MAGKPKPGKKRVVAFTRRANADRRENYQHTLRLWGREQANAYRGFLKSKYDELALRPASAPLIENIPGVRMAVAQWPGARDGHRIFFQETDKGILILRVLHTKMDWQARLRADS